MTQLLCNVSVQPTAPGAHAAVGHKLVLTEREAVEGMECFLSGVGRWSEGLEAEGHYIFILPLDSLCVRG